VSAPHGQSQKQIPHRAFGPVRNDKSWDGANWRCLSAGLPDLPFLLAFGQRYTAGEIGVAFDSLWKQHVAGLGMRATDVH